MKIIHIKHSCFSVELEKHILLFDYFDGNLPPFDSKKEIIAFSSHVHPDHFGLGLFAALRKYEHVHYVLSRDIHRKFSEKFFLRHDVTAQEYEKINFMKANETLQIEDVQIKTLLSTDVGVAYMVCVEGKCIYHAGDLNWWSWDGETLEDALRREVQFKKQIENIQGQHFDVAFHPLDSRQGENFYKGFDWFMKNTDTDCIVPMHYWEDASVIARIKEMDCAKSYRDRIGEIVPQEAFPYTTVNSMVAAVKALTKE